MDSPDQNRVHKIINQFRELGINKHISLPQLVVVGSQSSGKSSLLEDLTSLSFPIASDSCTRHATQIVLRRSVQEDVLVKISIKPGSTAKYDEKQKLLLESFTRTLEGDKYTAVEFKRILDEATATMGLPGPYSDVKSSQRRFSDDILKIELSGPQQDHLSVIDVPCLVHSPTENQTEEDNAINRGVIESYITDPRTTIMAVLDARNNLANQEIFRMARVADPVGVRTVGIITKCDAFREGEESGILKSRRILLKS